MAGEKKPRIPLPKGWTDQVRSAVLHVIALAQYATVHTRGWAANSLNVRVHDLEELLVQETTGPSVERTEIGKVRSLQLMNVIAVKATAPSKVI